MRATRSLVLILTCVGSAGCTPSSGPGIFDPAYVRQNDIVGKTTKQQIIQIYGEPQSQTYSSHLGEELEYVSNFSGGSQSSGDFLQAAAGFIPGAATATAAMNNAAGNTTRSTIQFWFNNDILSSYNIYK